MSWYDISHLGRGGAKEDENIDFVEQGCVQLAADLGEKVKPGESVKENEKKTQQV